MDSFRTFLEMSANRSFSHLLDRSQSDELMAIISASRGGVEIFPGATKQMEKEIRSAGYPSVRVIHSKNHPSNKDMLPGGEQLGKSFDWTKGKKPTFGIAKTVGGYFEDPPGKQVEELSLVVSQPVEEDFNNHEIVEFFVGLASRYNQLGVLIKLPGERDTYEHFPDGRPPVLYGTATASETTPYFTRLRKGKAPENRRMTYPNPQFPEE